jgi:hypothetical protein
MWMNFPIIPGINYLLVMLFARLWMILNQCRYQAAENQKFIQRRGNSQMHYILSKDTVYPWLDPIRKYVSTFKQSVYRLYNAHVSTLRSKLAVLWVDKLFASLLR